MSGEQFASDRKPGDIPRRTTPEVQAMAQAILDRYGPPPYTVTTFLATDVLIGPETVIAQNAIVNTVSDFVSWWLPHLNREKK